MICMYIDIGLLNRTISPSIVTIALYSYAHHGYIMKSRNTLVDQKIKEGFEMKAKLMRLFHDETGQAMTEYGLILALIAVAVVVILGTMGTNISAIFTNISGKLGAAV